MNYRVLVAMVGLLVFVGLAALNLPGSLEAAPRPQTNSPPAFDDDDHKTIEVEENTAAGDIGGPITATDNDEDTLTYRISNFDTSAIDVDTETGQFKSLKEFDHEKTPEYRGYLHVRDGNGGNDMIEVVVEVLNVDEDGTVSLDWSQPQVGTAMLL